MFLCVTIGVGGVYDGALLSDFCNTVTSEARFYKYLIGEVLSDVVQMTPLDYGMDYYNEKVIDGTEPSGEIIHLTIRGHGVCTTTLASEECSNCLQEAVKDLNLLCPDNVGGQIQLEDCRIRFENYHFRND
ncbi:hypothetical protein MLD38_026462 [Melastoma candidum]|uniref:Uncharacterized protein n=1 Tax=Melastoma candidum TaxID=119954 RepID=A0ACB9P015_9MYRT|nr:hypothetical protein MLD38_026462 [Melastoma candidum]